MDTGKALSEKAAAIAEQLYGSVPALEAELREIEKRKLEIESKLDAAHLARKRAIEFINKVGPDYQCPRCWVRDKNRSTISPLPSNTKDNLFACDTCGLDVQVVWVP